MNHGHTYTAHATHPAVLTDWLAATFTHSDAATWATRIQAGEVEVNDRTATLDTPLLAGAVVRWHRPPWHEPDVPLHFDVVHEDDDVLVVNKPSGLPTMPAGGFHAHTLLTLVRDRWPDASPMHRLGRGTSGLVLFGRTPVARSKLQLAFRDGGIDKVYRTLASGVPTWTARTLDTPIGPVEHPWLGTLHAASPTGKPARSDARVLCTRDAESVVEVDLFTGRPHQIRIHLAAAGHPLVGDPLYGPGGTPRPDALPGDLGYVLHAGRLSFAHPVTGAKLTVSSRWPDALTVP